MSRAPALPIRLLALPAWVGLAAAGWAGEAPTEPGADALRREAWRAASLLQFDHALHQLAQLGPAAGRHDRAMRAAVLLNRPPRSDAVVARVEAELRELLAGDPADEAGLLAAYLLARTAHVHRTSPDWREAADGYRALRQRAPAHPLATLAATKLALILLYDPAHRRPPEEAWAEAEALAPTLAEPAARALLHLTLARAYLYYDGVGDAALRHLQAALEAGPSNENVHVNTRIGVAETARELGREALALDAYARFLDEAGVDHRRHAVEVLLREHEADRRSGRP